MSYAVSLGMVALKMKFSVLRRLLPLITFSTSTLDMVQNSPTCTTMAQIDHDFAGLFSSDLIRVGNSIVVVSVAVSFQNLPSHATLLSPSTQNNLHKMQRLILESGLDFGSVFAPCHQGALLITFKMTEWIYADRFQIVKGGVKVACREKMYFDVVVMY